MNKIPLLLRRGGRDINRYREATMLGAAGVVLVHHNHDLLTLGFQMELTSTTPSARNKEASRYHLIAQPPLLS